MSGQLMALAEGAPGETNLDGGRQLNFERAFTQLCHILPLSRDGKTDEALDELVITVLVCDESVDHSSTEAVAAALDALFGVSLPVADVQASLDRACSRGALERSQEGGYHPTPSRRARVLERISEGERLERAVRDDWISQLLEAGVVASSEEGERVWNALRRFMTIVFARHGTLAVELLDPRVQSSDEDSTNVSNALKSALTEESIRRPDAAQAIEEFFDRPSAERSRYIAQLLDATFTFYALTAAEQVAALLQGQLPPLDVFVDTNFVFALVGIDESAQSELARELLRVISENRLPFRLYYHEKTEQEMRRTLDAIRTRLTRRNWSPQVSAAAVQTASVGGVELTYHRLNAEQGPIDPNVFMERWDHIGRLLEEEYGIVIYRTSPRDTYDVEEKGKLVAEYEHFVKECRPDPKPYETLDHDISVWLSVSNRRDPAAKSALHAGAMFLSLDRLFQRFDESVLRRGGSRSVVRPGQLLQVLRPLSVRREDFDDRFAAAVAAVEFRTVPADYEATRPRILSYLATYKDMPAETAFRILSDDVLAHRLRRVEEDSDEFKEAIESKVVQLNRDLLKEHEVMREQLEVEKRLRADDVDLRARLDDTRGELAAAQVMAEEEREARERAEQARRDDRRRHAQDEEHLEDKLDAAIDQHRKFREALTRIGVGVGWLVGLVGMLLVSANVDWAWLDDHENRVAIHAEAVLIWSGAMAAVVFPRFRRQWWTLILAALVTWFTLF